MYTIIYTTPVPGVNNTLLYIVKPNEQVMVQILVMKQVTSVHQNPFT